MRVVYFNHPEKAVSGGHVYNERLLSRLQSETGCEVVCYPQLRTLYPGIRQLFAPILELRMLRRLRHGDVVFWGDTTYKYHLLLLMLARLLLNTTNIIIIHHFPFLELTGLRRAVYECMQKLYYRQADHIIVPSPYTKDVAERIFRKGKVVYIPLPFETRFTPSATFRPGRLLYVGTVELRKGLHLLLESLAMLRKDGTVFTLSIVGKTVDSSYRSTLDRFISDNGMGDCVRFTGRISDEELEEEMREAEVFAFPSLLEGYGIVLVEAMSHGLPIVAFRNSAIPYTVRSGYNGLLAENRDTEGFAAKLRAIIGNRTLRQTLQQGMRETVVGLKRDQDFNQGVREFCSIIKE